MARVYKKKTFFSFVVIFLKKIRQRKKGSNSETYVIYFRFCKIKNGYFIKNNHWFFKIKNKITLISKSTQPIIR